MLGEFVHRDVHARYQVYLLAVNGDLSTARSASKTRR